MTAPPTRSPRWLVVLAVAGTAFAVLDLLEGFIALPLREWSSMIAAALLSLAGFAVERSGTIINTGRFTFEVVPACSGSTTLQVLLALGIVWCGSHPRLAGWRQIVAMALAVPLAVAGNGLRVAVLIALGDVQLQPVEGALHAAIGVCTFCLSLGALVLVAERLAGDGAKAWSDGARLGALLLLLAVLAVPVAVWCITAWSASPLDRFGWVFAIAAVAMGAWLWRRLPDSPPRTAPSLAILGAGLGLGQVGLLLEINLMQAVGVVLALVGVVALTRGLRAALALAPCWLLLGLATPVTGFLITRLTGITGPTGSLVLRGGAAVALVILAWLMGRRMAPRPAAPAAMPLAALALVGVALAAQIGLLTRGREADRLSVGISYLQGEWVGDDLPVGEQTRLLLGRDHLYSRRYRDPAGHTVDIIVTSTGGDRHRAHPPEYCLTGAGWRLEHEDGLTVATATGETPVARRRFQQGGQHLTLLYWFTDGATARGSYAAMLADDTLRRLRGQRSDWVLIRLIGADETAIEAFLRDFSPAITKPLPPPS